MKNITKETIVKTKATSEKISRAVCLKYGHKLMVFHVDDVWNRTSAATEIVRCAQCALELSEIRNGIFRIDPPFKELRLRRGRIGERTRGVEEWNIPHRPTV